MIPLGESYLIQIDITNFCNQSCLYCSRYVRHLRKDHRYMMSLDEIKRAIDSLEGFPGQIGIIGGEPLLHPEIKEVFALVRKYPDKRFQLFTSHELLYKKYHSEIVGTFVHTPFNPHTEEQKEVCLHQPITIACGDVIKDKKLLDEVIDNCWAQREWCPSINSKGAFFCEVAASLDVLLDGPGGWQVEPGWWDKTPDQFKDQVGRYCPLCGMPVPIDRELLSTRKERISSGLLDKFIEHNLPRVSDGHAVRFDASFNRDDIEKNSIGWEPGNYRQDLENG